MVEPPKASHKKKDDRAREKERLERELAEQLERDYHASQLAKSRPVMPREALKRTTNNNWVHITCAMCVLNRPPPGSIWRGQATPDGWEFFS